METKQEQLKGVVVPAITPVDKNDKVDAKALLAGALGIGSGLPVSPLEPADDARRARIQALIQADASEGRRS